MFTASFFTTDGAFNPATGIGITISAPGSTKEDNVLMGGSCFRTHEGIQSLKLGGGTQKFSGTSQAAPHLAGVVALMWEQQLAVGQTLSPIPVRDKIRTSAVRRGVAPLNNTFAFCDETGQSGSYTFDGEREGILWAPGALQ